MAFDKKFVEMCRSKLVELRQSLINQMNEARSRFDQMDSGGDEADQTNRLMGESDTLQRIERARLLLLEVDGAMKRIENNQFGICEETEEYIEEERLKAMPWTRLSIMGAEIREANRRRIAR